ncbi:hypothetical protein PBY51_004497 [Eleginops maclovinus]|uniref:Uncharacterized protein n=1 Tax=Eleginops maclovinus TaxID=56733 RepID=A0AAN7Y4S5_ELEMC|nr:hypothetical protein PBY51_004497 [Eleginops maclovinus]
MTQTQKRNCKRRKLLACAVAPPPPSLCPLSAYYPLSWGRTESPSEAEYEQHGDEQLTIAQTPRANPPPGKMLSTHHPLPAR